jgi:hypothetical protein
MHFSKGKRLIILPRKLAIESMLREKHGCPQVPTTLATGAAARSLTIELSVEKDWRRGSGSNRRIKVLQTSPLPLGYRALTSKMNHESRLLAWKGWQRHAAGAGDGGRTRDFDLGKVALYH